MRLNHPISPVRCQSTATAAFPLPWTVALLAALLGCEPNAQRAPDRTTYDDPDVRDTLDAGTAAPDDAVADAPQPAEDPLADASGGVGGDTDVDEEAVDAADGSGGTASDSSGSDLPSPNDDYQCPIHETVDAIQQALQVRSHLRRVDIATLPDWSADECTIGLAFRAVLTDCPVAVGVPHDILWWSAEHGWHAPDMVFDHDVDAECGLGFNIFHRTSSGRPIRLWEPSLPPWDVENWRFQLSAASAPVVEFTAVTVSAAPSAQDAISIRVPWAPDLEERRYYNCHNHISEVQARLRDGSLQPGSFELRPVECRGVSEPLWPEEFLDRWPWALGLRLRLPPRIEGVWTISEYSELPPGQHYLIMPPSCFWMLAFDNAGTVIDSVRPGLYVDQQPYYYGPTPVLDPTNFLCDELEGALVP